MGAKDFLFIGHRTSGKSSLGQALAERGWQVIDVDQTLEARFGATCSELLNKDPNAFRRHEAQCVRDLVADSFENRRVIVCGAGLEKIPANALVVWIFRDGWEESARTERDRLRPELAWDEELAWMVATREDRYRRAADLKIHITRGRSLERSVDEVEDLLTWVDLPSPSFQAKTFVILGSEDQLSRAEYYTTRLGLAGIEVRSDLAADAQPQTPYLASLRHGDPGWLSTRSDAKAFDIDLEFLEQVLDSQILDSLQPRRLIISSHSNSKVSLDNLRESTLRLPINWVEFAETKFAPPEYPFVQLARQLDVHTFLPQGEAMAWFRLIRWSSNALNFLPLGIKESRGGEPLQTPMDLQDWIPAMGTDSHTQFDALLGFPVDQSQGDWWHRRASLREGRSRGYVKIPCPEEAFQALVALLPSLGVVNLSVTTPLKSAAACFHPSLLAANTLKWSQGQWTATDTDEEGMRAVLKSDALSEKPRSAVVLGSGDVSSAIIRALDSAGWEWKLVRGRGDAPIPDATLLINATGRAVSRPHTCPVQLDLHYNAVAPSRAEVHLNGDDFFAAQAAAQRDFWFSTSE